MRPGISLIFVALTASAAPPPKAPPYGLPALARADFNRLAAASNLPLFWRTDTETPGQLDVAEVVVTGAGANPSRWVKAGAFTGEFEKAYRRFVELRRREAVRKELDQGRRTLVETDMTKASDEDKAIMRALEKVVQGVDALYELQIGTAGMAKRVPRDDDASREVFARSHGPSCEAALTQSDPFCSALPDFAKPKPFSWPDDVTVDQAFCEAIGKAPNAKELLGPFTIVRHDGKGGFKTIPYHVAYAGPAGAVASALEAAAAAVKSADEAPFKAYLQAAAKGFRTDEWEAADEAWAAMSADNSKWYLRVGPDETYWDPCQVKAGFHVSLALIDRGALEWQKKLTELRTDLEKTLAALIGPPYAARDVSFKLPEFINIALNAGDSRDGIGATIGQSLPNFGKVAEQSRGRTVAMVNLYTDADSTADIGKRDRSLFTDATFKYASDDPTAERLDTVMHEATHNLGPYGAYKVDGKLPEEIFGGRTDAILEELKAQTGAIYYVAYLKAKGVIDDEMARKVYTGAFSWAFGHIARGMTTQEGQPKTYSQLSAIQLGELMMAGAIRFVEGGDGDDPGRFDLDFEKLPAAIEALMKAVGHIKAAGDVKGAQELIARHVGPEGQARIHASLITERVLRYPKSSFVYAIRYE